jgi:2-iminobutanoate/2-iminopropanoate deaminase
MNRAIQTPAAPKAVGPYSQAMQAAVAGAGQFVFTAAQVAIDPATGKLTGTDVAAQTEQVLKNVQAILDAAGLTMADVVRTTVFLLSMSDFPAMNEVYARHFPAPPPARSTVAVHELPLGARVGIDAIAIRSI